MFSFGKLFGYKNCKERRRQIKANKVCGRAKQAPKQQWNIKARGIDGIGDDLVVETLGLGLLLADEVGSRGAMLLPDLFTIMQTKLVLMEAWTSLSLR